MNDTIAAISTTMGVGAISIIRVSGDDSINIVNSIFSGNLTKVEVVSGCFFMIRKDILELVGNFDNTTFLYYEENILACKLKSIDIL